MRIMTCNIWGDYFDNPVEARSGAYERLFCEYVPDIAGIQECTPSWYGCSLFESISDKYELVKTAANNYTPILVKRERFSVEKSGFCLYKDTPDPSKGYTYVVLRDKKTGERIGAVNTHFWWKTGPEHDLIRNSNAREITAVIKKINGEYGCPVFAFGDLNCGYGTEVFDVFKSSGIDLAIDAAEIKDEYSSEHGDPVLKNDGKWHGLKTKDDKNNSLDHIICFKNHHSIKEYRVVDAQYILDASDHSPVYIDII